MNLDLSQRFVSLRRTHPTWLLLASRNGPLILASLKPLLDARPAGILFEDGVEYLTAEVFHQFAHRAVSEPVVASIEVPEGLNQSEKLLYERLLNAECGRLEQEFLPDELIRECILNWANG